MSARGGDYLDAEVSFGDPGPPSGFRTAEITAPGAVDDLFDSTWTLPIGPVVAGPVDGETPRWRAGPGSWYSRIWVLLGPLMPWTHYAMPFIATPTLTLGSTATPRQIVAVKRQILKFRSPHAYPNKVILQFPGTIILGAGPFATGGGHRLPLTLPFTCPTDIEPRRPYCTWRMGKMMGDTLGNMPFVAGGYRVGT